MSSASTEKRGSNRTEDLHSNRSCSFLGDCLRVFAPTSPSDLGKACGFAREEHPLFETLKGYRHETMRLRIYPYLTKGHETTNSCTPNSCARTLAALVHEGLACRQFVWPSQCRLPCGMPNLSTQHRAGKIIILNIPCGAWASRLFQVCKSRFLWLPRKNCKQTIGGSPKKGSHPTNPSYPPQQITHSVVSFFPGKKCQSKTGHQFLWSHRSWFPSMCFLRVAVPFLRLVERDIKETLAMVVYLLWLLVCALVFVHMYVCV